MTTLDTDATEQELESIASESSVVVIRLAELRPPPYRDDDAFSDADSDISKEDATVTSALIDSSNEAPLGTPEGARRLWFSRAQDVDPTAIATQPSVYDNPDLAEQYRPRPDWENIHRFDPSARWTWAEERRVVRKIDLKIMIWTCLMFCALEMDRANIKQAVTDDLLPELGLDRNGPSASRSRHVAAAYPYVPDYNLGNSLFSFSFLCAEVPSQLISKWMGPDRWIPMQMVLWSVVASSQFYLSGRISFLASRCILGVLQGGFIPDAVLYLSYFYKAHELSIRLGFFWTAIVFADMFAAVSAFSLLHMRGVLGYSGWRWLFLIEGLITLVFGVLSFGLMPAGPTQTASWFRGKRGWFTPREEIIMVNRVIRDDPSKGGMHNREAITLKLLFRSLMDYDLWPIYLIGIVNHVPFATPQHYLTLSLKDLGFSTFETNILVIPSQLLHVVNMVALTYLSEITSQLVLIASIPQIWALPFLLWLRFTDTTTVSKWTVWGVMTIFLGNPYAHPLQVSLASRNSNTVRSRTVSAAMYNMCVQMGGIIAANIYRADDAPHYKRGNSILLVIVVVNIGIYLLTKLYYIFRNKQKADTWDRMSVDERFDYLARTHDAGNKRLDFRFAS